MAIKYYNITLLWPIFGRVHYVVSFTKTIKIDVTKLIPVKK